VGHYLVTLIINTYPSLPVARESNQPFWVCFGHQAGKTGASTVL